MSVRRTHRTRTAAVLVGITASLTGLALTGGASAAPIESADGDVAAAAPGTDAPSPDDSLPDVSSDAGGWPAELTEHTRLFVNPYRSYLVTMRDGEPTLVLSTGWDSCWVMTQHDGVLRYPC